jgi:hypothetical protein
VHHVGKICNADIDAMQGVSRCFVAVTLLDFAADTFVPVISLLHLPAARQHG